MVFSLRLFADVDDLAGESLEGGEVLLRLDAAFPVVDIEAPRDNDFRRGNGGGCHEPFCGGFPKEPQKVAENCGVK